MIFGKKNVRLDIYVQWYVYQLLFKLNASNYCIIKNIKNSKKIF